ncbi:MAG: hypothetical protein IPK85_00090 [Gemmatimonadetes bacterium]|nr:hypothetical protein [Gemmatimonadota bacterium]
MAEAIVRFVAGDTGDPPRGLEQLDVEPWLLSLVCEQLNERRLLQRPVPARIAGDLLTGSRDEILSQYYQRCIGEFDPRVSAFLEDRLLTEGGFRTPFPYAEAVRLDGIRPAIVDQLVDARLVRREEHLGSQRLEVTHNVLGPVMLRYREQLGKNARGGAPAHAVGTAARRGGTTAFRPDGRAGDRDRDGGLGLCVAPPTRGGERPAPWRSGGRRRNSMPTRGCCSWYASGR